MTSFGVLLAQDHPPAAVLDWARRFDEAGADSVWVADHLANPFDVNSVWFDGWTLLAAMAATTSRCQMCIRDSRRDVHVAPVAGPRPG